MTIGQVVIFLAISVNEVDKEEHTASQIGGVGSSVSATSIIVLQVVAHSLTSSLMTNALFSQTSSHAPVESVLTAPPMPPCTVQSVIVSAAVGPAVRTCTRIIAALTTHHAGGESTESARNHLTFATVDAGPSDESDGHREKEEDADCFVHPAAGLDNGMDAGH